MILVSGDCHIKSRIWSRLRSVEGDALLGFEQLIEYANDNEAEAIYLAGDVFDPPNTYSIGGYEEALDKLKKPTRIFGIDGQHDKANPSWLSLPTVSGEFIHHKVVEEGDLKIYGIRNTPATKILEELEKIPKQANTLLMHQLVQTRVIPSDFDLSLIPDHINYVFAGDLHRQDSFSLPGGGSWYYTGSLYPNNISELEVKHGFLVVDEDKIWWERVKTRDIRVVILSSKEDLGEFEEIIMEPIDTSRFLELPPVIRVKYDASSGLQEDIEDIISQSKVERYYQMVPYLHRTNGVVFSSSPINISSLSNREALNQFTKNEEVIDQLLGLLQVRGKREEVEKKLRDWRSKYSLE